MARNWDSWLRTAAKPASETEEVERDRTVARIRAAIQSSNEIRGSFKVFAKGSYANNTNVRRDSDVDIAVESTEIAYVETWGATAGLTPTELGYQPADFLMAPNQFRRAVERALEWEFGAAGIDTTGDKAIGVFATATTLEADVVPCFSLQRYDSPGYAVSGHRLFPLSGGQIDNFPEQHYANGVAKNTATGGRYKDIVRGLKRLESELVDNGKLPEAYPGYLTECLLYNVPDGYFTGSLLYAFREVLAWSWNGLQDPSVYQEWEEVNGLLYLFRGTRIPTDAARLLRVAWNETAF